MRTAPGLGKLMLAELRHSGLLDREGGLTIRRERNHDLLFVPRLKRAPNESELRIAEEILSCLIYGRFKVSDAQLNRLAGYLRKDRRPLRMAASIAGRHFDRLLFARWLGRQLMARGIAFDERSKRTLRVLAVDQDYYVCSELRRGRDTAGRGARQQEREGSLPPDVAAAMVFLAKLEEEDCVLDPVCGSATLLAESHACQQRCRLIGFDIDREAVATARRNLDAVARASVDHRDGRDTGLAPQTVSVLLANLPFGKLYGSMAENPDLYRDLLREGLRVARRGRFRAVLITSDTDALDEAIAEVGELKVAKRIFVRLRGEPATISLLSEEAKA